jgi:beta-galactosidase
MKNLRSFQLNLWSARVLRLVVALCATLIAACGGGGYGGGSSSMGGMSSSMPMITMQPTNQSVMAPAAATFSVTATNTGGYTGTLSYQWKRQNSGAMTFTAISGATATSYTTGSTSAAADNGAMFEVDVTNAYGTTTSHAAMLTVM